MDVKTLKELLDDYGDHLEVLVRDEDADTEYQTVSVEAGTGSDGAAIAILFVAELAEEAEWGEDDEEESNVDGG